MRTIVVGAIAGVMIVAGGCSSDPVSSPEEARAGWGKTESELASGASGAQAAGAVAGDSAAYRDSVALSVDYSHTCASGGTIAYKGNYMVSTDGGTAVEFDYAATFKKCASGGVTIDGEIDYSAAVTATDTTSSVVYSYFGDLTWKGEVEGSCIVELEASVSADVTTGTSVYYKGSVCGYDAEVNLNVG